MVRQPKDRSLYGKKIPENLTKPRKILPNLTISYQIQENPGESSHGGRILGVREHDASPTFLIFIFANHDGMIASKLPSSSARGIWLDNQKRQ